MPEMDGLEAAKKIRKIYRERKLGRGPVIIGITGHCLDEFTQVALTAGLDQVESKPLYRDKLEVILRKYTPNLLKDL